MPLNFDYNAAKNAGYSDTDILDGLRSANALDFDLDSARKAGYADTDILGALIPATAPVAPEPEGDSRGLLGHVKDTGLDIAKGVVSLGESVVGIGNLVTGGLIGDGLAAIGYDPKETQQFLSGLQSEARQKSEAEVAQADGFVDTLYELGLHPSVLIGNIVQSLPGTVASGAAGGLLVKKLAGTAAMQAKSMGLVGEEATKFISEKVKEQAFKIAAAAGAAEGVQAAGSIAESGRQAGSDWSNYVAPALAAGLGTAAIAAVSGGLSNKLGIGDIETDIATRSVGVGGVGQGTQKIAARVLAEGLKEGIVEEMPQSAQEQAFTNIATGRPTFERVEQAAATGLATGAGMGGGHALISQRQTGLSPAQQPPTVDQSATTQISDADLLAQLDPSAPIPPYDPSTLPKVDLPQGNLGHVETTSATVITRPNNQPFETAEQAQLAAAARGLQGYAPQPTEGGFVLAPTGASLAQAETTTLQTVLAPESSLDDAIAATQAHIDLPLAVPGPDASIKRTEPLRAVTGQAEAELLPNAMQLAFQQAQERAARAEQPTTKPAAIVPRGTTEQPTPPTDIVRKNGQPFQTEKSAALAARAANLEGYLPAQVAQGQWVLRAQQPAPIAQQPAQTTTAAPVTPQLEPILPQQAPARPPARRTPSSAVNPRTDDLLAAMGKLGGQDAKEAEAQGLDPALWRAKGGARSGVFGRPWVRKAGGRSFDAMAEALKEAGYFPPGVEYSPNALLDLIDRHLRGQRVMAPEGIEAQAEQDYEAGYDWESEGITDAALDESGYNDLSADERAEVDSVVSEAIAALGDNAVTEIKERVAVQVGDNATERDYNLALKRALNEAITDTRNRAAARAEIAGEPGTDTQRGEQAAREEVAGGREAPRDLFGATPAQEQALADAKRKVDERLSGEPVPVGEGAGDLFSGKQRQADIADAKPADILARLAVGNERVGGKPRQRGFNSIEPREGYEVVYKPYGNSGDKKDAGYYYAAIAPNVEIRKIGDKYAIVTKRQNIGESHEYYSTESEAHTAAARIGTTARLSSGQKNAFGVEDQAESVRPEGNEQPTELEVIALRVIDRKDKDSIASVNEALRRQSDGTLKQIPERASYCFRSAAEAAAANVGDMVIGETGDGFGNRIWHAVVARDGAIYDPTFGQWFEPGVYEALGFDARITLSPDKVRAFIKDSGGFAPDPKNQGLLESAQPTPDTDSSISGKLIDRPEAKAEQPSPEVTAISSAVEKMAAVVDKLADKVEAMGKPEATESARAASTRKLAERVGAPQALADDLALATDSQRVEKALETPGAKLQDIRTGKTVEVLEPAEPFGEGLDRRWAVLVRNAEGNKEYIPTDKLWIPSEPKEADQGTALFSRRAGTKAAYEARIDALFNGERANTIGVRVLDSSDVLELMGYGTEAVNLAEGKVIDGRYTHGLTAEHWKKIPEWLENPVAVFDSDMVEGRLVFIAPDTMSGKPIVMIVAPKADAGGVDVHLLVNAYDKTGGRMPVQRWVNGGLLRYLDEKQSPAFAVSSGLQLPSKAPQKQGTGNRVLTNADLVKLRQRPAMFSRAGDGPRAQAIPKAAGKPIYTFVNDSPLKAHADYKAAKSGDYEAAARLVRDLVKPENLEAARQQLGTGVVFVPAVAVEASGQNQIPRMLAEYYAAEIGASTSVGEIFQTSKAYHTGAGPMERLIARPTFGGAVETGTKYVLVDDVTTMGGTLAEMAHHIQSGGGEVVGIVALVNAGRSATMMPSKLQITAIERRYGDEIRRLFGIEPAALTRDEATYILGFRDAGGLRNRAATAERQRGERLRARGIQEKVDSEFAQEVLSELASVDEFFRFPVSEASSLKRVMSDVFPEATYSGEDTRVDERAESGADRRFVFKTSLDKTFYVFERGNEVWIDVSRLEEGERGSAVYAAIGNYTHNAGKRFVGDPNGLSEAAIVRRTSNMLSLALRFGTTRFMEASPEQVKGAPDKGIAPLAWRGDDVAKTRALIDTFLSTLHNQFPRIKNARYDFQKRQFIGRDGMPIDRTAFQRIANQGIGREARAGEATLRRGIFIQSLVSSESGQRPGILEQVLSRGRSLANQGGLQGLFSSTTKARPSAGLFVSDATARQAVVSAFGEKATAVLEREGLLNFVNSPWDFPPEIHPLMNGTEEAVYWRGRSWIVKSSSPADIVTRVLHEIGEHHGLKAMLGDARYAQLQKRIALMNKAGNAAVRDAWKAVIKADPDLKEGSERFVAEVLARVGQDQRVKNQTWWRALLDAIRAFIIKHYSIPSGKITQDHIQTLLRASVMAAAREQGQPSFIPGGVSAEPVEALYSAKGRQNDITALNNQLAEAHGEKWRNAYVLDTREHPHQMGVSAAIKSIFNTEVIPILPTKPEFNIIGGMFHKGKIYINPENGRYGFVQIAGHELLHDLKRKSPNLYQYLADKTRDYVVSGGLQKYRGHLKDAGAPDADTASTEHIEEEMLGDAVGDALADPEFLKVLAESSPGKFKILMRTILNWLRDTANKLTKSGFGSSEYFGDVESLRTYIAAALSAYAETNQAESIPNNPNILFSRKGAPSGQYGKPHSEGKSPPKETSLQEKQRVVQDKFNRFRVLQDWLRAQGVDLSEGADVYLAETRMSGRISTRKQDFRENQMQPLIKKTQAAGISMEQVGDFLKMQHAPEANKRSREIHNDPDSTAYGVSDQEAEAAMAEFKAMPNFAKLKEIADEWRSVTDQSKKILLDAGILSDEMAAAWQRTYALYVPVKGREDINGTGTGKGLDVNGRTKRRLGHERRDEAILENIWRDHERAITLDEKNMVGKSLIRFGLEAKNDEIMTISQPVKRQVLKDGQSHYMVTYHGSDVAAFDNLNDARRHVADEALKYGRDKADFDVVKTSDPVRVMLQASPMPADNEVNVYVGGHAVRIQINDEIAARAYKNMGVEHLNAILSAGREVNNWLSKVYTGYSPDFIFTNLVRDATQGFITLTGEYGAGTAARIFSGYPHAVKELAKHFRSPGSSKLVTEYRANGGSTGAAYLSDLERMFQSLVIWDRLIRPGHNPLTAQGFSLPLTVMFLENTCRGS